MEIKKEIEYKIENPPRYYCYHQNNSGGIFIGPETVIIKAESAHQADEVATSLSNVNIYFSGAGDCPCCGNRWSPTWDEYDYPSIWDNPIVKYSPGEFRSTVAIVIPGKYKLIDYSKTPVDLIEEFKLLEEYEF